MSVASSIIKHLEQLGYAVSTHDLRDYVEMHAVKLPVGEPPHLVARVDDVGLTVVVVLVRWRLPFPFAG